MTTAPFRVLPGDLIRADDFNNLVVRIEDLERRLDELGTPTTPTPGGPPRVDSIDPSHPRVGDTVTIRGAFFDYVVGAARVKLDGIDMTFAFGSSDNLLRFTVPEMGTIGPTGRNVTVVISNQTDSVTRRIVVMPAEVVGQGEIALSYMGSEPDPIEAGGTQRLLYQFVSARNVDVTFGIRASGTPLAIFDGARLLDNNGDELADDRLEVPDGETRDFQLELQRVPSTARSFTVAIEALGEGVRVADGPRSFTVGETGAQDEDIRGSVSSALDDDFREVADGNRVTLQPGKHAAITLRIEIAAAGEYEWHMTTDPSRHFWDINTDGMPSSGTFEIEAGEIPTSGADAGWAQETPTIDVTAPPTSGNAITMIIRINKAGETIGRDIPIQLVSRT
jgi:tetrahydromethanopterin S-methyltransferase subunit G